jgi:hypothetical protein
VEKRLSRQQGIVEEDPETSKEFIITGNDIILGKRK